MFGGFFNQYPYQNLTDLNLDYLIKNFKKFMADIANLQKWQAEHEKEYKQLLAAWEAFQAGKWTPELTATMTKWAADNLREIIGELMINSVFFEITDGGYFIAYIPESWEEITFNTTEYDISLAIQPQYGHLVLSY